MPGLLPGPCVQLVSHYKIHYLVQVSYHVLNLFSYSFKSQLKFLYFKFFHSPEANIFLL